MFFAYMDETKKLKFYFIYLLYRAFGTLQDPTLEGKLYHTFQMNLNQEGLRVLDTATLALW